MNVFSVINNLSIYSIIFYKKLIAVVFIYLFCFYFLNKKKNGENLHNKRKSRRCYIFLVFSKYKISKQDGWYVTVVERIIYELKESMKPKILWKKKTSQFDFKLWMRDVVLLAAEWKRDFERYCQTYILEEEIQFRLILFYFWFLCMRIWNKFWTSYIMGVK